MNKEQQSLKEYSKHSSKTTKLRWTLNTKKNSKHVTFKQLQVSSQNILFLFKIMIIITK